MDVIFADARRPVGIGRFARVFVDDEGHLVRDANHPDRPVISDPTNAAATWYLHLELGVWSVTDERDWLAPGAWTLRLLVGADDGDSHAYELDVAWKGDEKDASAVLQAALDGLAVSHVDRRYLG